MIVDRDIENFYILRQFDKFMIGHNGFIAGGCFKNVFNREKVKDVDVFFKTKNDLNKAIGYFDSMTSGYELDDKREEEYLFCYETENVKAYRHKATEIIIELCKKVFGEPKEIIENFDFTITKFAYYKEEIIDDEVLGISHIEYKALCDDKFFEHLHLKRLVTDDKILFPMSTFERTIRYVKYGYMPCKETKLKIAQAIHNISDEELIVGKSLYDGMD
jgi:hypothetical protein